MKFQYICVLLGLPTLVSSFHWSERGRALLHHIYHIHHEPQLYQQQHHHRMTASHRNMFTGIVEDMGTIIAFEERSDIPAWDGSLSNDTNSTVMTIQTSPVILSDPQSAYLGCSICVSGVCLTATHIDFTQQQFTVTLAPETLRKTYFGRSSPQLLIGSRVNLERAAEMSGSLGRNSGHYVQGHVDDVGTIVNRQNDNDSIVYTIKVPIEIMPYIVPKGFIAVDGTSLTVIDTDPTMQTFSLMLIPYTQQHIILPSKQIGDHVNIEVDVLSKYAVAASQLSSSNNNHNSNNNVDAIMIASMQERIDALEQRIQSLELSLGATIPSSPSTPNKI